MMRLWQRQSKGQDMMEFALLLPIIVMIILVIFDLGRVTFFYSTLNNISREGARYGTVHPCDSAGVISAATSRAIGIDPGDLNVIVNWAGLSGDCEPVSSGTGTVSVTANFGFTPASLFIVELLGGGSTFPLSSQTTMYVEL